MRDYTPTNYETAAAAAAVISVATVATLCLTSSPVQAVMVEVVYDFVFVLLTAAAAAALIAAVEVRQ